MTHSAARPRQRPNIIFLMADDMGYGDVGCYNPTGKIPTPNMDRLAREGIRFTDAHAPSAICTPTRYGLLTGRYCWRTRLKEGVCGGYEAPLIEADRMTLASMLKSRGYQTACIGKWHVGLTFHDRDGNPTEDERQIDFSARIADGPTERGFDYAFYNAGCGTCGPPYGFIGNDRFIDDSFIPFAPGAEGVCNVGAFGQWGGMMGRNWVTKDADPIIARKACDYIRERAGEEAPFFLYLTPNAPHEPCLERFVPDVARNKSSAGPRGDLVWLFDWIVGQVTETLEQAGIADNTLLVVTSDNGALPGDFVLDRQGHRLYADPDKSEFRYRTHGHKSNADWRGYKAHIWDGGHRIPFIARWPGMVPANASSDGLICLTDTLATCAAVADCSLPTGAAEDSVNILPALLGKENPDAPVRETVIHHSSFGVFSIRQGRWKLVLDCQDSGGWPTPRGSRPSPGTPGQLYDLHADPGEQNNLWEDRQDLVAHLSEILRRCRESDRNTPPPNTDQTTGPQ